SSAKSGSSDSRASSRSASPEPAMIESNIPSTPTPPIQLMSNAGQNMQEWLHSGSLLVSPSSKPTKTLSSSSVPTTPRSTAVAVTATTTALVTITDQKQQQQQQQPTTTTTPTGPMAYHSIPTPAIGPAIPGLVPTGLTQFGAQLIRPPLTIPRVRITVTLASTGASTSTGSTGATGTTAAATGTMVAGPKAFLGGTVPFFPAALKDIKGKWEDELRQDGGVDALMQAAKMYSGRKSSSSSNKNVLRTPYTNKTANDMRFRRRNERAAIVYHVYHMLTRYWKVTIDQKYDDLLAWRAHAERHLTDITYDDKQMFDPFQYTPAREYPLSLVEFRRRVRWNITYAGKPLHVFLVSTLNSTTLKHFCAEFPKNQYALLIVDHALNLDKKAVPSHIMALEAEMFAYAYDEAYYNNKHKQHAMTAAEIAATHAKYGPEMYYPSTLADHNNLKYFYGFQIPRMILYERAFGSPYFRTVREKPR
ncbi:MAG TPA: hypothetical protein VM260_15555, partial [Pirellula sp.]|nr:hypothetical protein [Pirellula sp.]